MSLKLNGSSKSIAINCNICGWFVSINCYKGWKSWLFYFSLVFSCCFDHVPWGLCSFTAHFPPQNMRHFADKFVNAWPVSAAVYPFFFIRQPVLPIRGLASNQIRIRGVGETGKKKHWIVWRANQRHYSTLYYSLPFLSATPSSPSRTLEGLLELTRCPSWALDLPRALLPELLRYKDRTSCGGPRTPSNITDANLDCAFVENALLYTDPWLWKVNRIQLS